MFSYTSIHSTVFLVFFLGTCNRICQAERKEAEKPLVDYLTLDYFSVEQSLWSRINSRIDKDTLFSLIRDEHLRFITNDFGAESTLQNAYVPSAGILLDNVKLVNSLFYNASVYLNSQTITLDAVINTFQHDILTKATKYSEYVFRESSRANFWEKGKNVSSFIQF